MEDVNVGTGSRVLLPGAFFFEFRLWGILPASIKISSPNQVWGLAMCAMVHVCPPLISKMARHPKLVKSP